MTEGRDTPDNHKKRTLEYVTGKMGLSIRNKNIINPGEYLVDMLVCSLGGAQRNPGSLKSNIPGFRCAPPGLHIYISMEWLRYDYPGMSLNLPCLTNPPVLPLPDHP